MVRIFKDGHFQKVVTTEALQITDLLDQLIPYTELLDLKTKFRVRIIQSSPKTLIHKNKNFKISSYKPNNSSLKNLLPHYLMKH